MGDFDKMPNWDEILTGKYPWNSADFFKVSKMYHELLAKSFDDSDLKEGSGDAKVKDDGFNKFALETQLALFMKKEFGNEVFIQQFPRFMEIFYFIEENKDQLEMEKLTTKSNGSTTIDNDLVEAFCVLPFSKKIIREKYESFTFDYSQVIEKVIEIKANGNK